MHQLKFGKGKVDVNVPDSDILGVLYRNKTESAPTEEEAVRRALANPIDSPRLKDIVKRGESVCIVICDITRAWQHTHVYLPILMEELLQSGVNKEDVFFVSATGTHRAQSDEEHKALLGPLFGQYKIYDHDCRDDSNMVDMGTTSHGVPVRLNRMAVEADKLIITGGLTYHFMAGWGGGRKAILPGISSYETVQANHALALKPQLGAGRNMEVRTGHFQNNVLHEDMVEAAAMVNPCFMFNPIMNDQGKIGWGVAGNWKTAHEAGTKFVDSVDLVNISEKGDLVIASAGGFPKDINLYQSSKTIFNGADATKEGGSLIVLSSCSEGYGNNEVEMMLTQFANTHEREKEMRREFTIAKYVGYCMSDVMDKSDFYLVTDMDAAELEIKTNMKVTRTLDEALAAVYAKKGKGLKTWLMPDGANTLPKIK